MVFIEWDDDLLLNIKELDEQHKQLVKLLDSFYTVVVEQKQTKETLGILLKGLMDYSEYHFIAEQQLMERYHYPEYDTHLSEHDKFVMTTEDFYERFTRGRFIISLQITNFLRYWISHHIKDTDKKLGSFLVNQGVH